MPQRDPMVVVLSDDIIFILVTLMLQRLAKLFHEPAFKQAPLTVLGRAMRWSVNVWLRRSPVFQLVPGGARLRVPADMRYTSVSAFLLRDAVEPELHYLQKFVGKGDIFVDVGANIGLFTLKAAPHAARVVAVEPGEAAGLQLEANIALNGFDNVVVVRKALADKPGTALLHHNPLGDDPQAFSLISDGSDSGSEQVEVTTLDTLVRGLKLPRVDCIKIDVEGAESLVIAGGMETISTHQPIVIFEINCPMFDKVGGDLAAAWNALIALGYEFYRMQENGTLTTLTVRPTEFSNIVARHRDSAVFH